MRYWLFPFFLLALGACSTLDSLNPFSADKAKQKIAELPAFEPKIQLQTVWQGRIGAAEGVTLFPMVVGRSVYAAAANGDLARFDEGKQAWRIAAGQPISGGVGADDKLVVVGTPKGEVLAFDAASGKPAWKAAVPSEVLAPPAVTGELVVVRAGDASITGLSAADGKVRWVYQRSIPALTLRSYARPLIVGEVTIAGFPGGKLVAIANNNGAAVWEATVALPKGSTELERMADITSSPVLDGDMVCAVAFQGRVACLDVKTGRSLWARDMSSIVGLDIGEKQVYVTDDKGVIYALAKESGTVAWKMDKLASRGPTRPLVLADGLAMADVQGVAHLLRLEDGAFIGRTKTDGSAVRADLARHADGFVVQTSDGGLFVLKTQTK